MNLVRDAQKTARSNKQSKTFLVPTGTSSTGTFDNPTRNTIMHSVCTDCHDNSISYFILYKDDYAVRLQKPVVLPDI